MKLFSVLNLLRSITSHPLNAHRKGAAVRRFLAWQIGSRLVPGAVAVNFVNEAQLLVTPGMTGATFNIYTGLQEFEDMAFVLHALRQHDVFVDVGANIGSYTILAGAVVGARCIAFEPIPQTYRNLIRNITLNGIHSLVEAHNAGVGAEEGSLRFTSTLDTVNHVVSRGEEGQDAVTVPVRTLDGTVTAAKPTIIKIDVEGYETNIIEGACHVLSSPTLLAVLMELNGSGTRYGFDELELHRKMQGYGFEPFTYAPFERKLVSLQGKNQAGGNTLYIKIKARAEVEKRVLNAPKFFTHGQKV